MLALIRYLLRASRTLRFSRLFVLVALAVALLSGAGYVALLALLSSTLAGTPGNPWAFAGFCLAILLTRLASQGLFNVVGLATVRDLRVQLCRRILATPLRQLETIGPHRLAGALRDEVTAISTALTQLPRVVTHLAISVACLVYLGWLSTRLFLFACGFMAVGLVIHQLLLARAELTFRRLREQREVQRAQLRALVDGAKELKLQRRRRLDLVHSGVIPTSAAIRRLTSSGNALFAGASTWGNVLFFIAVALLLFGPGQRHGIAPRVVDGYTLTLLYILLPLETFFLSLPTLGRAAAAVRKLDSLGLQLTLPPAPAPVPVPAPVHAAQPGTAAGGAAPAAAWRSLDLVDVTYAYGEEGFHLGPLRLSLRPGELVFLAGGNGSGKTTLAKVLTGLYPPASGAILVDGRPVTEESRDDYRQMFAVVFTGGHLLPSPGARQGRDAEAARGYLARLGLAGRVDAASLSPRDLSAAQRQRLALLDAWLEDRPIYFFDEWAADQDAEFREVFYSGMLPELRARGKAVIVASHDERYYGVADRLLRLADGGIAAAGQSALPSGVHA